MNKFYFSLVYIAFLSLLVFPFSLFSQLKNKNIVISDSTKSSEKKIKENVISKDSLLVYNINEENLSKKNFVDFLNKIDTSLSKLYFKNKLFKNNTFSAGLGNAGLPERNLLFPIQYQHNLINSFNYIQHYLFSNKNADYYKAITPFSDVFFTMGPKRQQILNALFTRNLGKQVNVMANYAIVFSPGIYKFQKTNNNHVILNSNFRSRNNKYFAFADYFYNRLVFQQNGGIKYDTAFTENTIGHDVMVVNLKDAESKMKESGFYFRQFFSPGFTKNNKDTIKENNYYKSFGRFSHSFLVKNQMAQYKDKNPKSDFYSLILLDSTKTNDSIYGRVIENRIEWSNNKFNMDSGKVQKLLFSFAVKHQYQEIYNYSIDTSFNFIIPETSLEINLFPFVLNFNGFFVKGAYQNNDFSGKAHLLYAINKNVNHTFNLDYNLFKQRPLWTDLQYISNHFSWNNDFDKISVNKLTLNYQFKKNYVNVIYSNIVNYIFYNENAFPKQYKKQLNIFQIELKKEIEWKKWNFDNQLVFQNFSNNNLTRIPKFLSCHSLYFSNHFFKKALFAQIGTDVTFYGSYSPLAYMPATGLFYLQHTYNAKSYTYVDFFIQMNIKRLKLFLKLEHLNSGLSGFNYFSSFHYPNNDRCFRLGFSWGFYN